jgi:hypothetical protein
MAGMLIENGSASSVTVASPSASRARIARLVGSASAAKTALSGSLAAPPPAAPLRSAPTVSLPASSS